MSAGLERLAARTLLIGFDGTEPPAWVRAAAPGLGGICLFGHNLRAADSADSRPEPLDRGLRSAAPAGGTGDAGRIAKILQSDADVLLAADEEGGDVTRLHYTTGSPTPGNYVLGAADDVAATRAIVGSIGAELRASGVRLNLAPDADVNSNPANPVIGVRSFGADPAVVSRHTAAYVESLQAQGVAACAKHFPGHGDTSVDSHLELPTVACDEAQWRREHLPPFAAAIEAGTRTVMTAHIRFPALDPDVPATLSRRILTDLLRGELGFEGVVITDALEMAAIAATYGAVEAAPLALAAGADLLCLGARDGERMYLGARDAIVAAVNAGTLAAARLEDAAARVEALHAWAAAAPSAAAGPVASNGDAAHAVTRRAAVARGVAPLAASPVLVELRNEPNLAVGAARWDLGGPLAALGRAPARVVRVTGTGPELTETLAAAAGHPVVVIGRDVPRHDWQREVWAAVRSAAAGAVLVDLGLPRPAELGDGPYVLVGGAARPNLAVAAELLVNGTQQD